jgi:hypothetical protein
MKMRNGWETSDIHEVHCKEDPIDVFPEMKLSGLVLNSYIYVSVGDLLYSHDRSTYFAATK